MRTSNTTTHKTRNASKLSPIIPSVSLPLSTSTTTLPHRRRPYRTPLTLIRTRISKRIPEIPSLRLNSQFRPRRAPLPCIFHKGIESFRRALGACLDRLRGLRSCEAGLSSEI